MIQSVLTEYGLNEAATNVEAFGKGLINDTWKVTSGDDIYILQRINETVFKRPQDIADNITLLKTHLDRYHPNYHFVAPIPAINGEEMIFVQGKGFFRLFPFIKGSHTIEVVETPAQAYEAAAQFGRFTRLLSGIDVKKLHITIPGFHNLSLRYQQFQDAVKNGNRERVKEAADFIKKLLSYSDIVSTYEQLKTDSTFHLRVTHHDSKISNILFDKDDKGIALIDLDTVMPGYFISDVGDMMRTYLSPASEEERDYRKIYVRDDFYEAIVQGYLHEIRDELTEREKQHFFYAGQFMIYMQALRFMADHLSNDVYYDARYPGHNLIRAQNQLTLLDRLTDKKSVLDRDLR